MWDPTHLTPAGLRRLAPARCWWVLSVDGRAAATAMLVTSDPWFWPHVPPGSSGFVHKLAVDPRLQGQGLGPLLLSWCAACCAREQRTWLRLDCDATRPALLRFYERCGFRQVDRRWLGPYDTAFFERPVP